MSESYIKAEIVRPKPDFGDIITDTLAGLLVLAMRSLVVWWFVAAWFPQYGITYWQIILPVHAVRALIGKGPIGRQLK